MLLSFRQQVVKVNSLCDVLMGYYLAPLIQFHDQKIAFPNIQIILILIY